MASVDCGFVDTKAANTVAYITEELAADTAKFLDLYSRAKHGDMIPILRNGVDQEIREVDHVVEALTGGLVTSLKDLQGDEKASAKYGYLLTQAFEKLYNASDDPAALLAEANGSARMIAAYKRQAITANTDTFAYRSFNGILKLFGVKGEVWKNTPNIVRHFEPAAKYYFQLAQIDNFTNSYNTKTNGKLRSMMKAVDQSPTLRRFNIDTEVFSKTFGMTDEAYAAQMSPNRLAEALEQYKVNLSQEDARLVYDEYIKIRDINWSEVNHGMTREQLEAAISDFLKTADGEAFAQKHADNPELIRNKALIEVSQPGSILGNFKLLRDAFNNMYEQTKSSLGDNDEIQTRHRKSIELMHKKINEMNGLFGYVPGNQGEAVGLESLFDMNATWRQSDSENLIHLSTFMFHRTDDAFNDAGDFLNSALTQIQASGIMFTEGARILAYSKIKEQVDANPEWFQASSARRAIEGGIRQYLSDLESIINSKKENSSTSYRVARKASAAAGLIPASYLMMPGSSVNNTLAANFMMTMVTGTQHRMVAFETALKDNSALAKAIDEYVDRWLMSTGVIREFETFTPPSGRGVTTMEQANSIVQKWADNMGEGIFALPIIPGGKDSSNIWRVLFSMKGSEERARSHIKGLLYNRIIELPGIEDLMSTRADNLGSDGKKLIDSLMQRHVQDAQYDIWAALGDFSPTAKPYWAHTMGDTAENAAMVTAGAMAKFLYAFRHPMITNVEAFLTTMGKLGAYWTDPAFRKSITPEMQKVFSAMSGAAGLGLSMACYEFYRDAIRADHNSVQVGLTETFNPFQDFRNPMNLFYASVMAPLLGSPLSDEAYNEIKASNIRFMLNLLGGKEVSAVVREDGGMQEFLDKMKLNFDLPRIALETVIYPEFTHGKLNRLYEQQYALRTATGNLTAADPLWLVERAAELAFIRDPINPEGVNDRFAQDNIRKMLLSMIGVSVWQNNPVPFKTYKSKEWEGYANDHATRVKARAGSRRNYLPRTIADYQLQSLTRGRAARVDPQRVIQ